MTTQTVVTLSTCLLALNAWAQTTPQASPPFIMVQYNKVAPERSAAFEDAVKTQLAKVMQVRANEGAVTLWASSKMLFPSGSDAKYNYVLATVYRGVPPLEPSAPELEKDWTKAGLKRAAFLERMNSLGAVVVKREIWRGLETVGPLEAGDLIRVDAKKVTTARDYVDLERNVYKAVWSDRIKQGAMKSWAFFAVQLPGGEDRPYGFVTVQGFKDQQQMLGPASIPLSATWKSVHPTKDVYDVQKRTAAVSHTASVEVARVLVVVTTPKTTSAVR